MISQFSNDTALLLIDVQKGVNDLTHWGGPTGRRNNPQADDVMLELLQAWRAHGLPVIYTKHDSKEAASPLKWSIPSGDWLEALAPIEGESVIWKEVNSGFIGTNLEIKLRELKVSRLLVVGYFTNFCVATTVRMAGNLGFDTYLVPDACATTNRIGLDGTDYEPELVHDMTIATLHGEFCTAIDQTQALSLLEGDRADLARAQGNE